jgi:hypothetical protein
VADPGRWDIDGPEYQQHYADPSNAPPEGDAAWMGLTKKQRQDFMWGTPVAKGADAAWAETPEQRRKDLLDMLEEHGSVRAWSDTKAFKEFENDLPKGIDSYHLKGGTTIFHKSEAPALTS